MSASRRQKPSTGSTRSNSGSVQTPVSRCGRSLVWPPAVSCRGSASRSRLRRWAAIAGPTLHLYTFVVLDDGRYEMQIYDRVLTDKGIDIRYERIVDGQVMRRITGTTARAKVGSAGD